MGPSCVRERPRAACSRKLAGPAHERTRFKSEIRGGEIKLEEAVVPCCVEAGLRPAPVLINDQKFTKTANCWAVDNNSKGTNTNRIVVFQKSP